MFAENYRLELARLREEAAGFAAHVPALASALAEPGSDPDVERIIESLAWLTTDIRARVDDGYPELITPILELIAPAMVLPRPSVTLLSLQAGQGASVQEIPGGSLFTTPDEHGPPCHFRTTQGLRMAPLAINHVRVVEEGLTVGQAGVEMGFGIRAGCSARQLSQIPVRVHIDGSAAESMDLYAWLRGACRGVQLVSGDGAVRDLGPSVIGSVFAADNKPLVPLPLASDPACRGFADFAMLPQQYLAVDLDLSVVAQLGETGAFRVRFLGDDNGSLPERLPPLQLNVVPAVNLYSTTSDAVRVDPAVRDQKIVPRGGNGEVVLVTHLEAINDRGACVAEFRPWHETIQDDQPPPSFQVLRRARRIGSGHDVHVALHSPGADEEVGEEMILRAGMLCSDGRRAEQVPAGTALNVPRELPRQLQCTVWTRPAPWRDAPAEYHHLWRHVAGVMRKLHDIREPETLRRILLDLVLPDQSRRSDGDRLWRHRVAAIESIDVLPIERLVGRSLVSGYRYHMRLSLRGFPSAGDWFLFGEALHRFLLDSSGINVLVELELEDPDSGRSHRWDDPSAMRVRCAPGGGLTDG